MFIYCFKNDDILSFFSLWHIVKARAVLERPSYFGILNSQMCAVVLLEIPQYFDKMNQNFKKRPNFRK